VTDGTITASAVAHGPGDGCAVALVSASGERRRRLASVVRESDLRLCAEVQTVEDLDEAAPVVAFDAVTADGGPETVAGVLDALRRMEARLGPTQAIVICRALRAGQLRKLLDGGVVGVLLDAGLERALGATIRAAWMGQLVVPQALRRGLSEPDLSQRQKEVLCLVVLGLSNAEIAERLALSEATVSRYVATAFAKLEVHSRADAVALLEGDDDVGAVVDLPALPTQVT
jgi:DNA-binding NarL/FixJ family response regulator